MADRDENTVSFIDIQKNAYESYSKSIDRVLMYETPFVTYAGEHDPENDNVRINWSTQKERRIPESEAARPPGSTFEPTPQVLPKGLANYHQETYEDIPMSRRAKKAKVPGGKPMLRQIISGGLAIRRRIEATALSFQQASLKKKGEDYDGVTATEDESLTATVPTFCVVNYELNEAPATAPMFDGAGFPRLPELAGSPTLVRPAITAMDQFLDKIHKANGMIPHLALLHPVLKAEISRILTNSPWSSVTEHQDLGKMYRRRTNDFGSVEIVKTSMGMLTLFPDIYMPEATSRTAADQTGHVVFIAPEDWEISYLEKYTVMPIDTDFDGEKARLVCDWGIKCDNPRRSGYMRYFTNEAAGV